MPIPLFVNPTAGQRRARRVLPSLVELLKTNGIEHRVVESEAGGDLEKKVRDTVAAGTTQLLVAGGDGSIHEAVNGILQGGSGAELGIIPVGRGNDFAKACSIPPHWEDAALLLADRLKNAMPARPVDIGRMNGRYFANAAGIGFDARVTSIARRVRLPIGDLVYLVALIRGLWGGVGTWQVSASFNEKRYEGPVTLVNISNGPWVGGLFNIVPSALNHDGELDLLVLKPVSRFRVLSLLAKLLGGNHMHEPEVAHARIQACEIETLEPVPSHLDGEVQPPQTRFQIELKASALPLL